jgi:hypothetical protein
MSFPQGNHIPPYDNKDFLNQENELKTNQPNQSNEHKESNKNNKIFTLDINHSPKTNKTKKKKCGICSVKLSLVQIECGKCPCGGVYCSKHRFETEHSCDYDFKTKGRERLEKDNQKIVNEKIIKI